MTSAEGERRLAAIMFTDIVGYTALTQENESATMRLLEEHRKLIRPIFSSYGGHEIKTIGDAFLVEFSNALDATLCAIAVQSALNDRRLSKGDELSLRIGINVGDVIRKENDVLGDAVNIASRIEPLADPGGICVSREVYSQIKNKLPYSLGQPTSVSLKNVREQVEVYKVVLPWAQSASAETEAYPTYRIAILPFISMSTSPDDAFFADGVTEEIISTVSGISGLKVISRTSVMRYKKTEKSVKEIGKELEVGSLLEGSFRKVGNRIRIATQLIDVARDEHLWAQNYDRELDDIFEVQSDVAKQVAQALRVRILSPEKERIERKPTDSTDAYALYLKGRFFWNKRGIDDLKKARESFESAVKEDPDFALGYAGVADSCLILLNNWRVDTEENFRVAKASLARALELDPELAEAHATRGLLLEQEYDPDGAETEYRRAIELKPSYASAHQWYGLVLLNRLKWDEAHGQVKKAVELDPMSPMINLNHGALHYYRGEFEKAVRHYTKAMELGYSPGHGFLGDLYGCMKRFDDMKHEYDVFVELNKDSVPLARLYADASAAYAQGDNQRFRECLLQLESHFDLVGGPSAYAIGVGYLHLGDSDKGFEWLERSYSRKDVSLPGIAWGLNPWGTPAEFLVNVRSDPRYAELLKKLGWTELPPPNL